MKLGLSLIVVAASLVGPVQTFAADIYFAANGFGPIHRIDSDSLEVERVFPAVGGVASAGLAFDSVRNRMVWLGSYAGQDGLFAAAATTFAPELLLSITDGSIRHPAVDPVTGSVYFEYSQGIGGRHNPKQIVRWNAATDSMETIVPSVDYTTAIAIDPIGRWLYWSQNDQGWPHELLRFPLDGCGGCGAQLLFEHEFRGPAGLAVDYQRQQIHWIGGETTFGQPASSETRLDDFDITVLASQVYSDDSAVNLAIDVPSGQLFMSKLGDIDGLYQGGTLPTAYAHWLAIDSEFIVPEPPSISLAISGLVVAFLVRRHRSNQCLREPIEY